MLPVTPTTIVFPDRVSLTEAEISEGILVPFALEAFKGCPFLCRRLSKNLN
jgi:hypothetical protein